MALNAAIVWEVRTTGAATNGGGFKTGASGTDWSQQDAAQYAVTDAVTNGTTTITSATANFGTDVVGNLLYITGGTGSIAADWYEITARTDSTTITVDRSTGLTTGTGATLNIGGAHSDPALVAAELVTGHTVHIKAGTYSITSASTNVAGGCVSITIASHWYGYQTTRQDYGTKPVLQASGISTATIVALNVNLSSIHNVEVDGASLTAIKGFATTGGQSTLYDRCLARGCTNNGFDTGTGTTLRCLATGNGTQAAFRMSGGKHFGDVAHDNTEVGFNITANTPMLVRCIADSNSGASSDGFVSNSALFTCINCVSYNNGRDGFRQVSGQGVNVFINCIAETNGGYGYNVSAAAGAQNRLYNCASYNNTSGRVNATPYEDSNGVTGSGSFFTNAAAGDFSLNNTAGAGAAARAVGLLGAFPGGLTTGYLDIGAAQHQDPAGGGGTTIFIVGD